MTTHKHLEPLLDGTPLAMERLKEAWPGISTSDKAFLLIVLLADSFKEKRAIVYAHHRRQLMELALADTDPYVRYLAAKDVRPPFMGIRGDSPEALEEDARREKIRSDSSMLVRFSGNDGMLHGSIDPEKFWCLPHIDRLYRVNGLRESGETIAKLLRYASKEMLPSGRVSLEEMHDVLLQFVGGKTIAERVADAARNEPPCYVEDYAGKSVTALWEVVPDLPARLSYVLIDCLPEWAGDNSGIPDRVIKSLNDDQLVRLLYRKDIGLTELRHKLYKESTNDGVRSAAVCFQESDKVESYISELVYSLDEEEESGKRKVVGLKFLAGNCARASLAQYAAIRHMIRFPPNKYDDGSGFLGDYSELNQTMRAKELSSGELKHEIPLLRLFALASQVAPISPNAYPKCDLPEKLKEHQDLVVEHNPWQTYINLQKVACLMNIRWVEETLPEVEIRDFVMPDLAQLDPDDEISKLINDDEDENNQVVEMLQDLKMEVDNFSERIDALPQEIKSSILDFYERNEDELSELRRELPKIPEYVQNMSDGTLRQIYDLKIQVTQLSRKTNILFWLIGGLLLLILFKIR